MERFRYIDKENTGEIPRTPGVYAFKNAGVLLYIGKAGNLRDRVKTHFSQPSYRDNLFVEQVEKMKENVKKTRCNSEELFNSLMQKAFRGEL